MRKYQIGVIGSAGPEEYPKGGKPDKRIFDISEELGRLIAQNDMILITGGKGGIMEAACRGAKSENGITVGVVRGKDRNTSNEFVDVEVVSGMDGCGEESMLILMCDALIGVGGGAGTLQELAIAYRNAKLTILIDTVPGWSRSLSGKYLDGRKTTLFRKAKTPQKAVKMLLKELN